MPMDERTENRKLIFREKALEKISSPEQLNNYLKVTNPAVWMILAAVILLLGGLLAWSAVGELETTVDAVAYVENGTALITMSGSRVDSGMTVRIGSHEYEIATVERNEYMTAAQFPVTLADGKYDADIVVERISPIKFLLK